jgi:hypothetical protein
MKRVFRLGSMPRMAYLAFQANYNRWKRRTPTEEDLIKLFERAMG